MSEERRLTIAGVLENVPVACDFVAEAARAAGLDERAVHHCHLAVDEACTNVVEHGYGFHGDDRAIDILCAREETRFVITIMDDSAAFDPLAIPEPDRVSPLTQRDVGGLGVFFIRKLMDEVTYHYIGNRNRLVMVKRIAPTTTVEPTPNTPPIRSFNLTSKIRMIIPNGRLDHTLSPHLEAAITREFGAGYKWIVVNLMDVDYISSAGLKTLVSMWQRTRELKGDLVLTTLKPRVREVLEIIGLDLVFSIYDSPEKATERISHPKA